MPCSLQISGTGIPCSACFKIDNICVSLNRDFFIENLLIIFYWNSLLLGRLDFWEDYPTTYGTHDDFQKDIVPEISFEESDAG